MLNLLVETDAPKEHFADFLNAFPESCEVVEARRSDAVPVFVQVLLALTPITLPLIAKLISDLARTKRQTTVKYKGLVLTGFTEDNAKEILGKLLEPGQTHDGD